MSISYDDRWEGCDREQGELTDAVSGDNEFVENDHAVFLTGKASEAGRKKKRIMLNLRTAS